MTNSPSIHRRVFGSSTGRSTLFLFIVILLIASLWIVRRVQPYLPSHVEHLTLNVSAIDGPRLGPYYVDQGGNVGSLKSQSIISMDRNGIPVVHYGKTVQYNAVTVSQYAFEVYHRYFTTHDTSAKNEFLKQARWLRDFCVGGKCVYRFSHPPQISSSVWISGMAQGEFISVQLRAYQLTNDRSFLRAASGAFGYLVKPLKDGGTLYRTARATWFEEYPQSPPTHVLNGHMFALFGLWDYYRVTRSAAAHSLFNSGQRTALEGVKLSDTGFWCRYDLAHVGLCSPDYLNLEISQLRALNAITRNDSANGIIDTFSQYTRSPRSYALLWMYNLRHPRGLYEKTPL